MGWCDIAAPAHWLCMGQLDRGYTDCLRTFRTLLDVELNTLVLFERAKSAPLDLGVVDEDVLCSVVRRDETEALLAVEPFHSSLCHLLDFLSFNAGVPINTRRAV